MEALTSRLPVPSRHPLGGLAEFGLQAGFSVANLVYALTKPELLARREFMSIYRRVFPMTMTSIDAVFALHSGVEYVIRRQVPGALVECGVWRGASSMAMALTLLCLGVTDRQIVLYDTFEG